MNKIHEHVKQLSSWKCFLLARWCIRHCLYKLAIDLLNLLMNYVHISTHEIWLQTLISICRAEERLQTALNPSNKDLQILCENLAEAGSYYESSLIQMPVIILFTEELFRNFYHFRQVYQLMIMKIPSMQHLILNELIVIYVHRLFISFMN